MHQPGNTLPANSRYWVMALVAAAAISRLLPHPENFTPIAAMALFAGAHLRVHLALAITFAAMLLTDVLLGFHSTLPFVYAALALTVGLGQWLARRRWRSARGVLAASLAASILFFMLTNFGVWLMQDLYPHSPGGLLACYVAAIPFFQNSVFADLFYNALLFGLYALLARRAFPSTAISAR